MQISRQIIINNDNVPISIDNCILAPLNYNYDPYINERLLCGNKTESELLANWIGKK